MTIVRRFPVLVVGIFTGLVIGGAKLIGRGSLWQASVAAAFPIGYGFVSVLAGLAVSTADAKRS